MKPNEIVRTFRSMRGQPLKQRQLILAVKKWANDKLAQDGLPPERRKTLQRVHKKANVVLQRLSKRPLKPKNRASKP